MKDTYTAVLKKSGACWIGWIEKVPGVNCQEATREAFYVGKGDLRSELTHHAGKTWAASEHAATKFSYAVLSDDQEAAKVKLYSSSSWRIRFS